MYYNHPTDTRNKIEKQVYIGHRYLEKIVSNILHLHHEV